jgi:hypothetical protein
MHPADRSSTVGFRMENKPLTVFPAGHNRMAQGQHFEERQS